MNQRGRPSVWTPLILIILITIGIICSIIIIMPMPTPTPPPVSIDTSTPPTDKPTQPPDTPPPTPLPPTPEGPENGSRFDYGSKVTLRWSCPHHSLQADECYRLGIRAKGEDPSYFYCTEDHFVLSPLSPGEYDWAVAIVRSVESGYELVSEESDRCSFEIAPPKPVVHSISPTSTVQGTSVVVEIIGEYFTSSLALTIGVPLQASFVSTRTITATIPTTLEVGEYPVIVEGSIGKTISFTVESQVVQPQPSPTPIPPPITLLGPKDNTLVGRRAELAWEWAGSLAKYGPDAVFTIWWGIDDESPHSQVWCTETERPGEKHCPNRKWLVDFQDCGNLEERTVTWKVKVVRVDWEARSYKQELVESVSAEFRVKTDINECPPDS